MNSNFATTVTGILKGITVASVTLHSVQDEFTFWAGLAYAVFTAAQGYMTNQPADPPKGITFN